MSIQPSLNPSRNGSSSRVLPALSINTSRSYNRSTSPVKSSVTKLYDLPSSLESPVTSNPARRARPGGFAGMSNDSNDSRSMMSERYNISASVHRGSDVTAPRLGEASGSSSPIRDPDPGPSQESLQIFAHHCRTFYLASSPSPSSANYISSTLSSVPPTHRAIYTKLQAAIRSLAHLHHLRVRISSFHALLSSIYASGSLTPSSRSILTSYTAQAERRDKLFKVLETWCTGSGAGGVEPFFKGLWAVFRLQSRPDPQRGDRRVVWEVDDAVFLESGGLEFMHEAVTLLKGVLGFSDEPLTSPPKLRRIRTLPKAFAEARSKRAASPLKPVNSPHDESTRYRALSDPFNDARKYERPRNSSRGPAPPPPAAHRHEHPLHYAQEIRDDTTNMVIDADEQELLLPSQGPNDNLAEHDEDLTEDDIVAEEVELNQPRFRLWTFPAHISDQEAETLMALFPRSIVSRSDVRFPYVPPGHGSSFAETSDKWETAATGDVRVPQLEHEGLEGVVRHGTGRVWTGRETRLNNYRGSGWFRFKRWFKRLFGTS